MGFHRKYLFKCDWCGKELLVEVEDRKCIDTHAFDNGYACINIETGENASDEYYACPDCLKKIIGGLNDGEA